jgi:hypothetical protein
MSQRMTPAATTTAPRMRPQDRRGTKVGLTLLACMASVGVNATPLQASFSSCLGSYNAANDAQRMVVDSVLANFVDGRQATEQGLIGGGHDVLRVDLVGTVGSEVQGYDNTTNKLGTSRMTIRARLWGSLM